MPKKYIKFTVKFKCFWIGMNVFNILSSLAMCAGSVLILGEDKDDDTADLIAFKECQSMKVVCWALFALHVCNFLFGSMALCGLEKRICNNYMLIALMIFDAVVLIWSQTTYFQSQSYNCNVVMPDYYFWLMGEILYFYCLMAFIVCYFFRQFCQDPTIEKEEKAEDAKELAEEMADDANTADNEKALLNNIDTPTPTPGGKEDVKEKKTKK